MTQFGYYLILLLVFNAFYLLWGVHAFHLFTSRWQFMRIGRQHSEVINDGLKVSDLAQHGDLSVLTNKAEKIHFYFVVMFLFLYFQVQNTETFQPAFSD